MTRKYLLMLPFLFMFNACSTYAPKFPIEHQNTLSKNKATIYFLRGDTSLPRVSSVHFPTSIYIDGKRAASLTDKSFAKVKVAEGKHIIKATYPSTEKFLVFTAARGDHSIGRPIEIYPEKGEVFFFEHTVKPEICRGSYYSSDVGSPQIYNGKKWDCRSSNFVKISHSSAKKKIKAYEGN